MIRVPTSSTKIEPCGQNGHLKEQIATDKSMRNECIYIIERE